MDNFPRITFGIIVLNGEPFIRYTLRALYPFAYQIIVVEGATSSARNIATHDGHSRDTTLATLHNFKATEDPGDKLIIITHDGFWAEKDEMSQAYAQHATGDYLWQVDVDEFYQPQDIQTIRQMLQADPSITAISFKTITFWGAPHYAVDSWYLRRSAENYHRIFKWGKNYTYITHRPPTVYNANGENLRDIHWVNAEQTVKHGIRMYHYSLLLPKQVLEKCDYYSNAEWAKRQGALDWAHNAYLSLNRPYHVHNIEEYPAWLYRYTGEHPPQLQAMWEDIVHSSDFDIRSTTDIEILLKSKHYRIGRFVVKYADQPAQYRKRIKRNLKLLIANLIPTSFKRWLKSLRS